MADRIDERELERTLVDVGRRLDYPERDLWPAVRARISARRAPWWRRATPRMALAPLATALVIVVAALALSSDARARAAEILGLRGVQIVQVAQTPSPTPVAATPRANTFGVPTTLEQAHNEAGAVAPLDPQLGPPDEVYLDGASTLRRATLVYRVRPGIPVSPQAGVSALVVEFRGTVDQNVMGKAAGPGTTVEPVTVEGSRGYWIAGSPHQFFYLDAYGNFVQESLRLAGNTLVWERNGMIYRLEAQVSKEDALRIAASFH